MKNFDSLERDLQALSARTEAPSSEDQRELQSLCEILKSASLERQRSSQHQEWAWTRCCAQMREKQSQPSFWMVLNRNMRWLGTGVALGLVALVSVSYLNSENSGPLPVVTANSESISAVPFHSPKAKADVIWVSGYNYLPASYNIR